MGGREGERKREREREREINREKGIERERERERGETRCVESNENRSRSVRHSFTRIRYNVCIADIFEHFSGRKIVAVLTLLQRIKLRRIEIVKTRSRLGRGSGSRSRPRSTSRSWSKSRSCLDVEGEFRDIYP